MYIINSEHSLLGVFITSLHCYQSWQETKFASQQKRIDSKIHLLA